jgi:hypothetical protein
MHVHLTAWWLIAILQLGDRHWRREHAQDVAVARVEGAASHTEIHPVWRFAPDAGHAIVKNRDA